jgi:glycosyltransferase involved in cell wall biosynthesis
MRVALELTTLEKDASGSARSIRGLLGALRRTNSVEVVTLAQPMGDPHSRLRSVLRPFARELIYLPFQLPRAVRRAGADLLHCPSPLCPVLPTVPFVLTLYDVMVWDHPEWFTAKNVVRQRMALPFAAQRATRILTCSSYSRDRILAALDVNPERVMVAPLGVDEQFTPGPSADWSLARLGVTPPFILTVGTLQPRKNLETALSAFERLVAAGANHSLVVAGAQGWSNSEFLRRCRRSKAASRIAFTGRVTESELVNLYRGAECLVFPSRYEGFGLPAVEAMACGTPVICSGSTSLPEIVGDAGILVDPNDLEAFEAALTRVLSSSRLRDELSAKGLARARNYSWDRTARVTLSAYAATSAEGARAC